MSYINDECNESHSYLKKIEYEIIPKESFSIIRNCSGCGKKTYFKNTKKFRVNANGNKLDVWLIYHCENCRHTFNLTIYERQQPSSIPKNEYECFLNNDEQLAEVYGRKPSFFKKNKAEVDYQNENYCFTKLQETVVDNACSQQILLIIHNPYCLKIRPEKQIAEVLGLSRSYINKLMEPGEIKAACISLQFISIYVSNHIINEVRLAETKNKIKPEF